MQSPGLHVITGAFGYSGKYIAQRLLDAGARVRTLTNSPHRPHPFGDRIEVRPLAFDDPDALTEALRGADVLYNTYWVRFNHRRFTHGEAVRNTRRLFEAAQRAGVQRVVHTSITNPSEDSPLEYFHGKAVLERALIDSGLSYAILRPAVLFGREDILINNIAWMLRRFPIFGVFGNGQYRLQPIFVDDFATLAVAQGRATDSVIIDAIGPETFTYRELVQVIGQLIGRPRPVVSLPPRLGYAVAAVVGRAVGDVLLTWDEVQGLMADLLYTASPPAGQVRLTDWTRTHAATLGGRYASELARRVHRDAAYDAL